MKRKLFDDGTRYKCVICGKITAGRNPGNGTAMFPRRHKFEGKPCPGNIEFAEWVNIKFKIKTNELFIDD